MYKYPKLHCARKPDIIAFMYGHHTFDVDKIIRFVGKNVET